MNEKYWDEIYSDISRIRPWEKPEWVNVCKKKIEQCLYGFSQRKCPVSLLDFGCGSGTYFPLFLQMGMNCITGVDISKTVVKYLKKKYEKNPSIQLIAGGIETCPSNGVKYDVIVFWGVAHHINPKEWDGYLQCFQSHLSDDGVLLVSGWGGGDPRFRQGSPAFSVHSHKQTWSIDGLRPLLESRFTVEEFGNLHFEDEDPLLCSDAFDYYVCKKKMSIESRQLSSLRSYLSTLYDRISFTQFIRYSFEADVKNAQMDRETSITYYRDKEEVKEIFGRLMQQVTEKCGRGTSFTTEIYQRPQKNNIFVEMSAAPQKLVCVGSSEGIRYSFVGGGETCSAGGDEAKRYDIQSMSVKELFSLIEEGNILRYTGCEFDKLEKVGIYSRDDAFAEKLFYAFNHGKRLFFYYFNNATLSVSHKELGDGGLMIYASSALSDKELKKIDILFKRWASTLSIESFSKLSTKLATKSAIASIMSRNGSHNIGSHVLAALSHNVGTMPDDRVLYQYIQHRMDYIATVTTELPSWAASTMFIGEMMRAFLSQHHLLEYIASSEGLKAYKFQDLNIDLRKQFKTVQIHVSYGSSKSALMPVFSFDGKGLEHPIENDVALAIPGGVVGQHAFFTIVENVIRNAAKHGWSSEAEDERKKKNLEIHIDVVDDANKDYVTFCIWDNMSSVDINCHQKERGDVLSFIKKIEKGNGTENTDLKIEDALSAAQASILIKRYEEETSSGFSGEKILAKDGALPLHWRQQVLMDQRIIHPDGSLRRENWGLAEIKISAGYLQRRTVGQMGGLDVLQGEDYIVRAIVLENENDKKWHLGYEFKVSRPRKMLIVTANPPENISEWIYEGVHFLELSKAKELLEKWRKGEKTDAFSAEYLVVESVCEVLGRANFNEAIKDLAAVPFPFRVLAGDHVSAGEDGLTIIPFIKMDDLRIGADWKLAKDIVTCVSETWMDYCCKRWDYDSASVHIDLNTSGNEGGAGQALISDADIWRLLFTEYFHSTLESFSDENCAEDIKSFRRCLLENRTRYKFFADDLIVIKQLAGEKLSIDYLDDNSIIARQFQYLLRPDNMIVPRNFPADKIKHELEVVMGESEATDFAAKLQALYSSYLMDCRPDINRMIRHFKLAFKQLDVMLRKYEERIVTLPHAFSILKEAKGTGPKVVHKDTDRNGDKVIIYNRHHKVTKADLKNTNYLYVEPLSGSQSYLNRLSAYSRHDFMQSTGDQALIKTQLIENALMRILIVDERVSRFLRSHDKSRLVFRAMNIWCLDETGKTTDGCLLQEADKAVGQLLVMTHNVDSDEDKFSTFLNAAENAVIEAKKHGKKDQKGPFDILIIHQGILDKWCKDAASVTGMETIIDKLKEVVDYVVITTGRGTPANIPPCTRILPFSTIESTLFKLYPEKMTLVDSIMNVLPLGGIRK